MHLNTHPAQTAEVADKWFESSIFLIELGTGRVWCNTVDFCFLFYTSNKKVICLTLILSTLRYLLLKISVPVFI